MATRIISTLVDDLDGSEAAETVQFSLDGRSYEIDLSSTHADQLRAGLLPYLQVARKETSTVRRQVRTAKRALCS